MCQDEELGLSPVAAVEFNFEIELIDFQRLLQHFEEYCGTAALPGLQTPATSCPRRGLRREGY